LPLCGNKKGAKSLPAAAKNKFEEVEKKQVKNCRHEAKNKTLINSKSKLYLPLCGNKKGAKSLPAAAKINSRKSKKYAQKIQKKTNKIKFKTLKIS